MLIPKILHQQFSNKSELHEVFLENVSKIRKLNPDWEYCFYEENDRYDFISKYFGRKALVIYERINPCLGVVRADIFKYMLIYVKGGLYLDIKSTTNKRLNDVLRMDDKYILSHWTKELCRWGRHPEYPEFGDKGEFQQWYILAEPGHPYLESVVNNLLKNIDNYNIANDGIGKYAIVKLTGPIAYTVAVRKVLNVTSHRLLDDVDEIGLDYSFLRTLENPLAHQLYFKNHYNSYKMAVPIVNPPFDCSNIRRNELCPCGSGRKVKHCHGAIPSLN